MKEFYKNIISAKFIIILIFIFLVAYEITNQKQLLKFMRTIKKYFINSEISNFNIFDLKNNLTDEQNKKLILSNGKKYIDKCLSKEFILKVYNIDINPTISVIIPVYNSEKTIYSSINSIQNQNFSDFEIILINDFSKDNSSNIIESLKEKDKRIKLVNNKKNMGSLYSRSIGVIISKGEYIFSLDNDDLFFNDNIFDYTLKIALDYNFDIVEFRAVKIEKYENISIEKMRDLYNYQFYPKNII